MHASVRISLLATCAAALGLLAGAALTWIVARPAPVHAPGPIDIGFAQAMSLHHQQAIAMAQLLLEGAPTPLAPLARGIAGAQLLELGEMRGWLRLWGAAPLPPTTSMDWMRLGNAPPDEALLQYLLDCQRSPTGMSGLATDAEIQKLRTLTGRERDAHFLKLMLAHHQGGLPMARFAATQAAVPIVRELATRVVLEQSQEIVMILRTQQAMAATAE